jgi:conserved oligomeric Golgi complex subunit 4
MAQTDLDSASSVSEIEEILNGLLKQESALDASLASLASPANQPDISALTSLDTSLQISAQISQLSGRLFPASETAVRLSERVRRLDVEQARVKESLKYVEDVQELKVTRVVLE